ncbi:MAG: hypothetical protein KDJ35_06455 [Alphaproteobacteria bacterium]|nr:hypothetical protein [Alphaproteobacteria bacterium]
MKNVLSDLASRITQDGGRQYVETPPKKNPIFNSAAFQGFCSLEEQLDLEEYQERGAAENKNLIHAPSAQHRVMIDWSEQGWTMMHW